MMCLPLVEANLRAMAVTADAPRASAGADFGSGKLFVADSRLALMLLNYGRRRMLQRLFGITPDQANLLTVVLALGAADVAYLGARHAVRAPLGLTKGDATVGAVVVRQGVLGITGPGGQEIPMVGTLMMVALVGGAAVPAVRRLTVRLRAAEGRIRHERIRRYQEATAALRVARATIPAPDAAPAE
jgi:hypothetical protein